MIYITQLIYIKENKEATFNEFEAFVIPFISKYNGKLLLRTRPTEDSIIESSIKTPYEIHIVSFDSENDFKNYLEDNERNKMLHLKEDSIESSIMFKSEIYK